MVERGQDVRQREDVSELVPERPYAAGPFGLAFTMPTPRAAAASVLAVLGFGVLVGSFGTPSNLASLVSAPLLVAVSPQSQNVAGTGSSGSGGGGGSSGGGVITQTVTVGGSSQGGSSSAGGGGGGSSSGTGQSGNGGGGNGSTSTTGLPPIHHVFLIVMSDQGFGQTFSPASPDRYLGTTLPKQGEVVEQYYAVAASPLANRIALISGQGPTQQTAADCPKYDAIKPAAKHAMGQVIGNGCVYPKKTLTLADQLTAGNKTWKAYIEGIDKGPHGQPTSCRHPKLGATDGDQTASAKDPYVTWSDPFVYFSSLATGKACSKSVVGLDHLDSDLKSGTKAPTLAFIAPDPCHDGSDQPCAPTAKAGVVTADEFLRTLIPQIKSSAAYKDNGLIAVTFDEAPQSGPHADSSSCCNTPKYPNLPATTTTTTTTPTLPSGTTTATTAAVNPGETSTTIATSTVPSSTTTTTTSTVTTTTPPPAATPPAVTTTPSSSTATSPTTTTTTTTTTSTPLSTGTGVTSPTGGGGQVGLLLISPYVKPGTTDVVDYFNHFSLLGSIETLFSLKRIGYARDRQLAVFDSSLFTQQ
jgi:phosphatidylinositol-3-phosphatase